MEIEAAGAPAHTRTLDVTITRDDAGHALARGTILDLRKRGLVPMAGDLQTAGVIHDMRVTARIRRDPPTFESASVEQPSVAFEPSPGTGGECCRDPRERLEALAGTPLAEAPKRLGGLIGGPLGCSHVLTLSQWLASSAATALAFDAERHGDAARPDGQRIFQRSLSIDGVEARDALHLTLQQADVHFAPVAPSADTEPLERLAARHEVRAHAEIDVESMQLRRLRAAERASSRDDLYGPWRDRSPDLADFAGRHALGGMAGALFERLGGDPADRPLLDALLGAAPAIIQCIPPLMERWMQRGVAEGSQDGASEEHERSKMMASGGMADSCYMWRRDGFLVGRRAHEAAARSTKAAGGR